MSQGNSTEVEYRDIPGFPAYRIGSDGSIWSRFVRKGLGRGKGICRVLGDSYLRMNPTQNKDGYYLLNLRRLDGSVRNTHLHRVIAEVFVGDPPSKKSVARHWDGNPANNNISNIVWGTTKDNSEDSRRHGTMPLGQNANSSKLTNAQVAQIKSMISKGIGNKPIAALFGVTHGAISLIRTGRNWKHLGMDQ